MTIGGVALAAGGGRRFGRPKALVEFNGSTLVVGCVRTLAGGGCDPVVAVIGAQAATVMREARTATRCVVVNAHWREGQATSLRAGLAALTRPGIEAAVVALADQPLVTGALVARLIDAWDGRTGAVAATYAGALRPPVLLNRSVWAEVVDSATGDQGARVWMLAHHDQVLAVACDDVGRADDIDIPRDLELLRPQG